MSPDNKQPDTDPPKRRWAGVFFIPLDAFLLFCLAGAWSWRLRDYVLTPAFMALLYGQVLIAGIFIAGTMFSACRLFRQARRLEQWPRLRGRMMVWLLGLLLTLPLLLFPLSAVLWATSDEVSSLSFMQAVRIAIVFIGPLTVYTLTYALVSAWIMRRRRAWRGTSTLRAARAYLSFAEFQLALSLACVFLFYLLYRTVAVQATIALTIAVLAVFTLRSGKIHWWRRLPEWTLLLLFVASLAGATDLFFRMTRPADDFARRHIIYGPEQPAWQAAGSHKIYDLKTDIVHRNLYFTNSRPANTVGRIDLETGEIVVSAQKLRGVEQLAIGPADSGRVYAGRWDGWIVELDARSLEVIAETRAVPAMLDMSGGPWPGSLAFVTEFSPWLYWRRPIDGELDSMLAFMWAPYQVLCSTRLRKCFLSGWLHDWQIAEVTFDERQATGSRSRGLGLFSLGMAFAAEDQRLLISRPLTGCIDVIDTAAFRRIDRLAAPLMVRSLAYAAEADLLFLPDYFTGRIDILRLTTGERVGRLKVGSRVREILWDEARRELFVADRAQIYRFPAAELLLSR